MSFWPKKQSLSDITINSLWSLLAWVIWSIIIVIITFWLSNSLDIVSTFQTASVWIKTSSIFPLILSIITLLWTTITSFLTYFILNMTAPEKYKKNIVIFWQLAFFQVLTYVFITPVYIYTWVLDYDNIMIVYLFHILTIIFWTSIILDALNNYRYILIWLYGSFVWLFVSSIFTVITYTSFTWGYAKLIILVALLPLINFTTNFFKQLFEIIYYMYFKYTSLDQLWDIFYQIELEEKEKLREEEEKNTI